MNMSPVLSGCAAAVGMGSVGAPRPNSVLDSRKHFARAAPCPCVHRSEIVATTSKRLAVLASGLEFHIWQVPRTNSFGG